MLCARSKSRRNASCTAVMRLLTQACGATRERQKRGAPLLFQVPRMSLEASWGAGTGVNAMELAGSARTWSGLFCEPCQRLRQSGPYKRDFPSFHTLAVLNSDIGPMAARRDADRCGLRERHGFPWSRREARREASSQFHHLHHPASNSVHTYCRAEKKQCAFGDGTSLGPELLSATSSRPCFWFFS